MPCCSVALLLSVSLFLGHRPRSPADHGSFGGKIYGNTLSSQGALQAGSTELGRQGTACVLFKGQVKSTDMMMLQRFVSFDLASYVSWPSPQVPTRLLCFPFLLLLSLRQVHSTNTMMLQTVEQAHDKVAALGKALYSQLFLWLVAKLNTTISAPQR